MHDRLRASCMLPFHCACVERLWHETQTSDTSRGFMAANARIFVLSPVSEWSFPGPWHVSHDWFAFADGVRTLIALPCSVVFSCLSLLSWQATHVSSPTNPWASF